HDQLDLPPEHAALAVHFRQSELGAVDLAFALRGVGPGQRVVHADLDRRLAPSVAQERRRDQARSSDCQPGFDYTTAIDSGHVSSPHVVRTANGVDDAGLELLLYK